MRITDSHAMNKPAPNSAASSRNKNTFPFKLNNQLKLPAGFASTLKALLTTMNPRTIITPPTATRLYPFIIQGSSAATQNGNDA